MFASACFLVSPFSSPCGLPGLCSERTKVVVHKRNPGGLDGLSQARGWKGLDDEELMDGSASGVSADSLKRQLNRAMMEKRSDSVVAVFRYAGRDPSDEIKENFPYSDVHSTIKECMNNNMWTGGLAALTFLETCYAPVRRSTYAVAAGGLARSDRVIELRDLVMKLMRKQTCEFPTPDADERICALAANIAVENNRLPIALEIAEEMEKAGVEMGALTFSILIKGYGRKRSVSDVKRQLMKMKALGVEGDLVLYNTAIDAFVRSGMMKLAEQLVQRMKEKGVDPDHVSYNTLVKGLVKAERVREAFRLRKQMQEEGFLVDDTTMNSLIQGCVQARRFGDALRLLDEVISKPCSAEDATIAYTTIVAGLAKSGDVTAAADFMDQMRENMIAPNVVTYTAVITGALALGDVRQAWDTFREMELNGVTADKGTFKAMISGLCSSKGSNGVEAAKRVLETMQKRSLDPDTETFNMIINGYVRNSQVKEAEHMIVLMKRADIELDVVTYTILLKAYGMERNMREVRRIFQEMRKNGIEPDIYSLNTFLASCVRSGDVTLAFRLFRNMVKDNLTPDIYTYTTIIAGLVRDARVAEAWSLYRDLKRSGMVPNERLIDLLMQGVRASSLDSLGVSEARTLLQDARAIGISAELIREYTEMVEQLEYITSETWKQRSPRDGSNGDDDNDEFWDTNSASQNIFRNHDWNEIDSSFKMF
uniref:Pentacotripeptide-repeat region of PRORP domain-containing protein n=2 Tax=Rhodosorus marinus TaxID=101924 RepID=A0A7S3E7T6_9RHOD|mmetsp:Transcript_13042/g.51727  ORF Transcript_13042/g.51727 Transcript_13042/m.51727 type:complete len:709 (+) Transcript_13042:390-2516(+)|eukprot:CAMPEP_0113964436 /NCGR_PEP_ID=MMETSP0011_2-20120614/7138_1 /TAXON_ID=101924 /ORGANISM="Rhodosorus marinus" /LENGTH=708 /DNA_ID=CAMNT_0000976737 /DNA_START=327 /DNA_END=2453 /DNA_ORIENTATION=- /assembly_acc=CAM_ASM_000156